MQIARAIRLLLLTVILLACNKSFAVIVLDSIVTKESNCANDGQINLYAHSPSPMLYALIAGPEIRPVQSGNQFAALARGTYQVRITNFSNDTLVVPATVGGTYTFPDFAPTFLQPRCAGTATGVIYCNPIAAGRPPFTWLLTDLNTNITTTTTADTFGNIPAGSYSIRQFDSCQSFATRYLTIADPFHDFVLSNLNNRMFACDSVDLYIQLYLPGGNHALPYTIQIETHNGTYSHILNSNFFGGWYCDIYEQVGGVTYGDYCNITITDACGRSQSMLNTISPFIPQVNFAGLTDSCQPKFAAYFSIGDQLNPNIRPTYMNGPVTVALYDPITGAPVDSFVNPQFISGYYNYLAYSTYHSPGEIYTVRITDACNHVYTGTYVWPNLPPPDRSGSFYNNLCRDSTIGYNLRWDNYFYSTPTFELTGGPARIVSTKPHYERSDTVIYPQQRPVYFGGSSGNGSFVHSVELANLGIGTYYYRIQDSCGNSITDSFTVRPQDVNDLNFSLSYTRGCPGQNTLILSHTSTFTAYANVVINGPNFFNTLSYLDYDTIRNLNAGTYVMQLTYYRSCCSTSLTADETCVTVFADITIPPYEQPKIDYAVQIKCNGTVNVGLQPDSSKGIPPYNYEILSGPQTSAVQPSNFFTLTQPGSYVARIGDACGFARTFTFSVDTLDFQQIVKVGSSCVGNTATLICQHSPYATYVWQKPNGTFYTGDSLYISPVTPADYGNYLVSKIVNVNGCRDTFYTTYTLTSSSITYLADSICPGSSRLFDGRTLTQAGTYYDTIPGTLCDSIVALTLHIATVPYDSVSRTICTGQSVTVGTHTYNTTGIYRDTLTTANGCDSIHVLNLTSVAFLRDSVARTICTGQTLTIGGGTYTNAGIYRDTLTTSGGCDSIFILNLTAATYKYDSIVQFICYGKTASAGGHTYTTTGIYRDTIATSGCDSIHVLNLTVGSEKRDSIYRSICTGQSVTIGMHTYTTTGIYRDTFNVAGCDSLFVLNLQVGAFKRDSLAQTICYGQTITIGANAYTATGIYRDTFTTTTCDSIFTLNLTVLPLQLTALNQTICNGENITVGSHAYNTSGTYTDTLTGTGGCDSIVQLGLTVLTEKHDSVTVAFCEGDSAIINNTSYHTAGFYYDTLTTGTGCDSFVKVTVLTFAKPILTISANATTIARGDTVQLNATSSPLQQYYWQGNASFTNAYIPNPVATVYESGWLVVQATNANNCTTSDSLFITVSDCNEAIFIPNAFTPNGDGQNDILKVLSRCVILQSFRIFNRWGELVYETSDITQGWDGTFKGAPQMPGVYVYTVQYFANNPNQSTGRLLKGSVSLIR